MSSGIDPKPIRLGGEDKMQMNMESLIQEAYRQGWQRARQWPNHPIPETLNVSISQGPSLEEIFLRIEWP